MTQTVKAVLAIMTIIVMVLILLLFINQPKNSTKLSKAEYYDQMEEEDGDKKLQEIGERMELEFEKIRDPKTNRIPPDGLQKGRIIARQRLDQIDPTTAPPVSSIDWVNHGPSNVGGRTRAILFDANDPTNNTVFTGGVNGGIWKTTNFLAPSTTWTPINDFFENIAISSIVQDPESPSIMYFGTGEGWFNADAARGLGIWKSTDGGDSWSQLAATDNSIFYYVQDLLIDNNGYLYASTRDGGVRRSTNGGTSFSQVLGSGVGAGTTNRAADLELGPDGDIYASLGIFSTGSIFHSADNLGTNTGALGQWTDITPSGLFQRIELATAPSQSGRVYAICQGSSGNNDVSAIRRTDNHGVSWAAGTVPFFCDQGNTNIYTRGQAWYDLIGAVDPSNANRLYIGGVDGLRSENGGVSWTQITSWVGGAGCAGIGAEQFVHADHHMIVFVPGTSNELVWGTDGGLFYTADGTANLPTFVAKNRDYNITQYYSCAIHPGVGSTYFLAGAQDNGTQKYVAPGYSSTFQATGGDGGFCHIDQDNPNIQMTSFTANNYNISTDGGKTFIAGPRFNTGRFINPSDYDNDANMLYAASNSNQYFRWTDPATGGSSSSNVTVSQFGGQVSAVTASPNVANRVYFGTSNGEVIRVDGANTGSSKTGTVLRNGIGYVSSIEVEDGNEKLML